MARVKRGKLKNKKRKRLLKKAKGYKWGRKSKKRAAKEAVTHAGKHALNHRRKKKRDFRKLWQVKIGAALKEHDLSYSKFIKALKDNNVELDRKILADLAENNPDIFKEVVKKVN